MSTQHRLTIKSQVTIPKDVRSVLGVRPGDLVRFEQTSDGRIVIAKGDDDPVETIQERRERIRAAINSARGSIDLGGTSTDDYMRWLRGDWEP